MKTQSTDKTVNLHQVHWFVYGSNSRMSGAEVLNIQSVCGTLTRGRSLNPQSRSFVIGSGLQ